MTQTNKLLERLKKEYAKILKDNLVGIYLHGSYVMGSYNEEVSDLDYIVVVKEPLKFSDKQRLMNVTIKRLWPLSPQKGLEFHVLLLEDTSHFTDPLPFDFHFSQMHLAEYASNPDKYIKSMHGKDPDLAAHITILNRYGQELIGAPIEEVFSEVPSVDYWRSITADINDADQEILSQPMYIVLNLCRVLAYKQDNLVTSKLTGGEWGLRALPEKYHPIIQAALTKYTLASSKDPFDSIRATQLDRFARLMLKKIRLRQ